jgi:hypothetical protein
VQTCRHQEALECAENILVTTLNFENLIEQGQSCDITQLQTVIVTSRLQEDESQLRLLKTNNSESHVVFHISISKEDQQFTPFMCYNSLHICDGT